MRKRILTTAGLVFALTTTAQRPLQAQADPGWIGKRVVQRASHFSLRVNDEPVERSGKAIDFYRVEQADGPSLWLKAETQGSSGWAAAVDVVPVDQALDFFSQQIVGHPTDAFLHAVRAFLWLDKKGFDNALRDYDDAIRLEPRNASYYRGRGLVRHARKEYDKSITDFDESIRLDPTSALAFIGRGASRGSKKEYTKAIADYSEAIWLDPLAIAAYDNRGLAWHAKKEFDKAIIDYNLAIRLDPQHNFAYCNRGNAWNALGKYTKAIADYDEAIRIDPKCASAHGSRAWISSTCPDATYRDGKKAVESALRACELTEWKDAQLLGVLAAAYAEAGDFESAVTWQTRANALDLDDEGGLTVRSGREPPP
jgi:tetratricopeptide (TPR) repeat protein